MTTQAQSFSLKLTGQVCSAGLVGVMLQWPRLNGALACVVLSNTQITKFCRLLLLIFNVSLRVKIF